MNSVVKLKVLDNYRIQLTFDSGEEKIIDFKPFIGKGFSAELLNPEYFSKVEIESGGGITWPNGYDFCPNFLKGYSEIPQTIISD